MQNSAWEGEGDSKCNISAFQLNQNSFCQILSSKYIHANVDKQNGEKNETTVNKNNGIGDACSTVDIFNGCYRRTLLPLSLVSRFSRSILAGGNVLLGGRAQFPESGAESSNKGETDENKELFFKLCLFRGPAHK